MSKKILVRNLAEFRERCKCDDKVHQEVRDHLLLGYPVVESEYVAETTVNEKGETVPVLCYIVDDEQFSAPPKFDMLYEPMLPDPGKFIGLMDYYRKV